jgi:arylformamidase
MHKMRELSRYQFAGSAVSRRLVLGAAAAVVASPARAEECRIGPPKHAQGPGVWLDMDQVELDAAYDQSIYAPLGGQIRARIASTSEQVRTRLGAPQRLAYGPSEFERLDVYRTGRPKAPIFVYFHGGAWLRGSAKDSCFPAEMFVRAGHISSCPISSRSAPPTVTCA